jgi:predicted small secreted protein
MRIFTIFLLTATLLTACNTPSTTDDIKEQANAKTTVATQMKIDNLKSVLQKLQNGQTEFDFLGITSNGTDCIYFVKSGDKFAIEFEVMTEVQKSYVEKLKDFAKTINCNYTMTTYKNKPQYQSDSFAPVIRLETLSTLDHTANFGTAIQSKIFGNTDNTVYDIVP